MSDLKVAAIQMDARVGAVEANLAHATGLVQQAVDQGAQLVVLPEMFSVGYEYTDRNYHLDESLDGQTGSWIVQTARQMDIHLVGSFPARMGGGMYIVALLAAPDGRLWVYRKVHVAFWENCYFERGTEPLIAETDLGRIGFVICWDQVFADLARAYQGRVDLLCILSSPPVWFGTFEDRNGCVLARLDETRNIDGVSWFRQAQELYARSAGVPVICASRCGTFHSQVPYGSLFLLLLSPWDALHVLRAVGTQYLLRCPMQGRSCILNAEGERIASAGQDGEAVLAAVVQPGAPDPATLPPVPRGMALVPGMPRFQFWYDGLMISLGRWYASRHAPPS